MGKWSFFMLHSLGMSDFHQRVRFIYLWSIKERVNILWVSDSMSEPESEEEMIAIPMIDMAKTGMNIAALRKQTGYTVRQLQDIFGFGTPQAIYKWQQGVALPTIDNLVVLAALFGVKVDDILVMDKATGQIGA